MKPKRIPRSLAAWLLALWLLLAGIPALASTTTYYVANSGNDANAGTDPAFPKQHIQAAINATVSEDTIIVFDDTYTGVGNKDLDFGGRNITLRSASGDPAQCILDCGGNGRGFTFHNSETSAAVVSGFTIQNASNCGMVNAYSSSPTVTHCTFSGNSEGGMLNSSSSPTVTHCTFSGNSGRGGMLNQSYSSPTVTNCTFTGNSAYGYGGGMLNYGYSSPTVTNCTFSGNSAPSGGGMVNQSDSSPTVTNCTFSGNSGGGMLNQGNCNPMVTDCILWGDTPGEIGNTNGSSPTVTYSDVQGGYPGTGNLAADPLFLNPAAGDLRLQPTSPCVNAGCNRVVTSPPFLTNAEGILLDLDGNPRIQYDIVDMGAYEAPEAPTSTVSGTVTLEQMNASAPAPTLTLTFRLMDNCGDFERSVTLNSEGVFTLTDIPRREYIVHVKGMKWLAQNQAVNVTTANVVMPPCTLKAADANNDNIVDVLDLHLLIQSYDATATAPNWNEGVADFDCNGIVDVDDLSMLIRNFDAEGDN